ncbi:hypothetical protein AKJ59_00225 [candidate division MSBL1 archaeon SCGC-AAA385M02]|uniref:Uncharacterized protein n=1 Tax=candidate division MSBL1 archaeon SCGC-AAA385M02 TaxID=1698287 RepID=A0A133VR57_9EURY|nr:hypothetical protein AKJ59_00225 [candidate division MSBL1 archaeon SCGC-AAA385M02]
MKQATGDITGSYNSGSEVISNTGSGDFSLDQSTMAESNNTAQNDMVTGQSTLDNSDNSVNENWTDDNSNNSVTNPAQEESN